MRLVLVLAAFASIAHASGLISPAPVEWAPGELLIKIGERRAILGLDREATFATLSAELGVSSVQPLDLLPGHWVRVRFDPNRDVNALASRYRELPDVEAAEPNYRFRLVGDRGSRRQGKAPSSIRATFTPTDPSFSSQWGLIAIQAPAAWDITQGSPSQVIAVIDTGVDLDHPDLASKIWTNPNEVVGDGNSDNCPGFCAVDDDNDGLIDEDGAGRQAGSPGYDTAYNADDDENGFIDDLRGWDFVGTGSGIPDNDPQDDNGHGTHCAGIAAAATNNDIGIAGVCPNCRIMPLKAFLADGTGAAADIAKAIEYAQRNGATVISMTFSSSADAAVVRDALNAAYLKATLVAAAGNDRRSRSEALCAATGTEYPVQPVYPAHYSTVIGVEAHDQTGAMAGFSNCGYPVRNPGVDIPSTVFDDNYATWSGTSMAAPHVAGTAGLLRALRQGDPNWPPGLLYGQLVQAQGNALQALTLSPQPKLRLIDHTVVDSQGSCPLCDGDGIPDAGETVNLVLTIINDWDQAIGVTGTLSTIDPLATVVTGASSWGAIGPNVSEDNADNPFRVSVSSAAPDNSEIVFSFIATASNGGTGIDTLVRVIVRRGLEKGGVLTSSETWTAENLYLVTNNLRIDPGAILTIEPGTEVRISPQRLITVRNGGELVARGTAAARIRFLGAQSGGIQIDMQAPPTSFDGLGNYLSGNILEHCSFTDLSINPGQAYFGRNIVTGAGGGISPFGIVERNLITNLQSHAMNTQQGSEIRYNTVVGNGIGVAIPGVPSQVKFNTLFGNSSVDLQNAGPDINVSDNYWGTTDPARISEQILDFFDFPGAGVVTFQPVLTEPSPQAPPVVTSVQVNPGSPVGPGRLVFTVVFSRPMDQSISPQLFFGPSFPHTANAATLSPTWTNDRTWTVETNITVFTGDGNQTVLVMGARDLDGFPIPFWDLDQISSAPRGDFRFRFEIATSGTSAAALQATGQAGRVDLTWTASTVETLAGYNVYRAGQSGGPYAKLNSALVSGTAYSDMTAAPGIRYYYIYRVVNTSLQEGPDSNEAFAAAVDTVAPVILHTPRTGAAAGVPITIAANITDNAATPAATLYYRPSGSVAAFTAVTMMNATGTQFSANIPGGAAVPPGVEYYLEATDGTNISRSGSSASPHLIAIGLKGDLNGDGTIGVADVLYLANFLFAGGTAPVGSADVNGSGGVDIADLFYLMNHLFAGGPAPV